MMELRRMQKNVENKLDMSKVMFSALCHDLYLHMTCLWIQMCALLEYFHVMSLYTSTPSLLRGKYCTFYSTTFI